MSKLPAELSARYKEPYKIFGAPGCAVCKHKGQIGRIAAFEIFEMTPELADLIVGQELNENKIIAETRRQGMISLRQDGILKALDGLVNIEEVLRETEGV